jgi:hypothetical protein
MPLMYFYFGYCCQLYHRRYQGDARTKARAALLKYTSMSTATTTTTTTSAAATTSVAQQHHEHSNSNNNNNSTGSSSSGAVAYHIKIDSPYLQPLRDEILLLPEENSGAISGAISSAAGSAPATSTSGTPRTPSQQQQQQQHLQQQQQQQQQQRRPVGASNLPKFAEICTPGAAGSGNLSSNFCMLLFSPKSAGAYPARVTVCGVSPFCSDIRCYDVRAVVTAPAVVTELVFR